MNKLTYTMVLGLICWYINPALSQQTIVDSLQKRAAKMAVLSKDSVTKKPVQTLDSLRKPSRLNYTIIPRKATLYSLIPGGGQVYNRQYWKAPFVWAAFGAVVYFIRDFNGSYKDFLNPYLGSYDSTGKVIRQSASVYIKSQGISRDLTLQQITQGKDFYRRYRDLNWFLLAGVFALAAVEANVSAHLKDYNKVMANDNLSLRIEPDAYSNNLTGSVIGVKIVVGLK